MGVLGHMYNQRLAALLGIDKQTLRPVHGTRLRERILLNVPDLEARLDGREYCLVPSKAALLNNVIEDDMDESGIVFDRLIKLMRKELESYTCHFTGQFNQKYQEDSVPPALLAMCSKMLYGSIPPGFNRSTKPAVTIAQLIFFNFQKCKRDDSTILRHHKDREPPLPVFLGLSTWGRTRMRNVVDTSHALGLGISSFRVREITAALCHWVVDRARHDGAVIPANLRLGVFTVFCYYNVDWNPVSNTSTDSFHGTGISVLQMPTTDNQGVSVPLTAAGPDFTRSRYQIPELPTFYSQVPAVMLSSDKPLHSVFNSTDIPQDMTTKHNFIEFWKEDRPWLQYVEENYKTPLHNALNFSWSGFHASRQSEERVVPGINSLMPLFYEDSNSVAMVVHGMRIAKDTTQRINPGQLSVFCCDQPLFATAKIVQWNLPEFSEHNMFVMFGPFHVEQNFLKLIGQFSEGCGLVKVMSSSNLFTEQSVQSLLAVNSVKKSRAIHHVLASVLFILLQEAYKEENPALPFEKWLDEKSASSDLFYYWLLVLNLQILLFRFIWSLRTRNYSEYCEVLKAMVPWYFSMDRHHYARWVTVHVKDIVQLHTVAPELHREFQRGHFSFPISAAKLSCVGFDQVHEQNNKVVKGDGGVIGLTHDPDAMRRWTIGGPEVQRLLQDFEESTPPISLLHHEQYSRFQKNCQNQTATLVECFRSFRNPFFDSPRELLALDTLIFVGEEGSASLRKIEAVGRSIHKILEKFVQMLYGADFPVDNLDELRLMLYTKKCRKLQDLPPTSSTLRYHVLRSAYVAGQIWGQAGKKSPRVPSPVGWGWTDRAGKLDIEWSSLPPIWEAVRPLIPKCGCTTGCSGKRCKCRQGITDHLHNFLPVQRLSK